MLHIPDTTSVSLLYVAAPGTSFHHALQRLRALDDPEAAAGGPAAAGPSGGDEFRQVAESYTE